MIIIAIVHCMMFTPNWLAGSLTFIGGNAVWIIVIVCEFTILKPAVSLAFPLSNYAISLWITPLLFYWTEKRVRHSYFLQWKISLVFLFGISIGIGELEEATEQPAGGSAHLRGKCAPVRQFFRTEAHAE